MVYTQLIRSAQFKQAFHLYLFQKLQDEARGNSKLKHEHQVAVERIKFQQAQIEMLNQVNTCPFSSL